MGQKDQTDWFLKIISRLCRAFIFPFSLLISANFYYQHLCFHMQSGVVARVKTPHKTIKAWKRNKMENISYRESYVNLRRLWKCSYICTYWDIKIYLYHSSLLLVPITKK